MVYHLSHGNLDLFGVFYLCCDSRFVNINHGVEESVIKTVKTFDSIGIFNSDQSKVILRNKIESDIGSDLDIAAKILIQKLSRATCAELIVNRRYPKIT